MGSNTEETSTLRIVSKEHYDQQYFFDLSHSSLPPLAASSVRIKSRLVGLGSNNLSYCAAGDILKWWDMFTVPSFVPAPYNDQSLYGIGPGWGYAEVLESNVPSIKTGTVLWGFVPLSAYSVDLELRQADNVPTHWLEVSHARKNVMPLYKRYSFVSDSWPPKGQDEEMLAWTATFIVFDAGYLLNRFVFASQPEDQYISPLPDFDAPWSAGDADLSASLVISLGAGSKTSRAFVQQLATNRGPEGGPKGLIEVTSTSTFLEELKPKFAHRVVGYDQALSDEVLTWIQNLRDIKRVMVVDCGSRNIVDKLTFHLRDKLADTKVDVMSVGGELKVYTPDDLAARQQTTQQLNASRMNTSGIREVAMQRIGEEQLYQQKDEEWEKVVRSELERNRGTRREGQVLGVKLRLGNGLKGEGGLEQTWTELCESKLLGDIGPAFKL